ncbi:Z1 domain-containing protein [Pseudomonas peradeniyensis]|uniref:Z1 domain-containing protein n=1 Tax=Pseudomonas peradeniyensis TaxID=2745488 RepID=UPI0021D48BBD|nr:Z1 domain-containing protein [Pseudomonas peradeniyensis]MCU7281900.1 Z1 domain-containing protein [Pseudomonas peradeniyensis]
MSEENKWTVIQFVQTMLSGMDEKTLITPELISKQIEKVLCIMPERAIGLNRNAVIEELINRFSIWVGDTSSLVNMTGHIPWLTAERKHNWRYWQRYREWQERKLPWKAIEVLDKTTDHTLSMLEDPQRDGNWDRRGMVVGHVQSGKTANYTGLICKAADAGYKIIIVLAGLHNNLRSQTQMRLDEGFLGYETTASKDGSHRLIGVGLIDGSHDQRPQYVTNRADNGDFNLRFVKNLGVSPEHKPWLFVVKKNKSVLTRLLKWIHSHVSRSTDPETGRPLVTHLPLLIIDDEADHASVDTGEDVIGDDGKPDVEHEPTAINKLIRQLLHSFSRKAYVGYTATPFANIYIHERGETKREGPDLFPSAFITNLSAPSNYIGPSRVFGLAGENGRDGALDLVRAVEDHCSEDGRSGWMPAGHKSSYEPQDEIPASLIEAINAFILTCCIRHLRGQQNEHSSMLVHVTRYNLVQQHVHRQIEDYVSHQKQRVLRKIDHQAFISNLRRLWENDFLTTSAIVAEQTSEKLYRSIPEWSDIESLLPTILEEIKIRMINGTAKDALDYAESSDGLKVIAVGGDKLARGLTLEGLCISYFLRASKMYDTLMQMGRWFGYRPAYLDLCRLYTTPDLIEWFEHIADAAEELRAEFDYMMDSGLTPRDYGLKVRSHPVLMVTSPLKMRTAKTLYLSFSGQLLETVSFFKNEEKLTTNLDALISLTRALGTPSDIPSQDRDGRLDKWKGISWTGVTAQPVIDFLRAYQTHPDSRKVRSDILADFVEKMSLSGELNAWTVAVIGGGEKSAEDIPGHPINRMKRTNKASDSEPKYSIGRLLSPHDEALDLDENSWRAALQLTQEAWRPDPARSRGKSYPELPSGPYIRQVRGLGKGSVRANPERGLLLIYILDPYMSGVKDTTTPVVAFAVSFPSSTKNQSVPYVVANLLWEQEYGGSE